jgi:hypothetical protein
MHAMKLLYPLLGALMMALAVPAWADVSRDSAIATAQQVTAGRVLAVEKATHDGSQSGA